MRKISNYITLAMALLFLACQEKEVLQDEAGNTAVSIEASIAGHVPTKANTEGNGTQWMAEDKIAIRNTAKAEYFTYVYRNDAWGPNGNIYLKWSGNDMTVVAYSPETAKDGNFTLPTDQSDVTKLRSADFMSTATTTNGTLAYADTLVSRQGESYGINLTMYHRMAKVILNFTSKKNITELKLNSAYAGFANNEPTGNITAINPLEGINTTTQGQTFTAVVVADKNGQAEATFLSLLESGDPYSLKGIPAMQPGYEYTYSLMFNDEKKLSIADVTVTPWVDKGTIGSGTGHKVSYAKRGWWNPMIVKDGDTHYLFCSDSKIPGYPYTSGIQVFSSSDLINFTKKECILDNVLSDWGMEKFKSTAEGIGITVNEEDVYIGHPYIVKLNNTWFLLYTIQDDVTPVSITGYATTTALDQPWTDQGLFHKVSVTNAAVAGNKFYSMNPSVQYNPADRLTSISMIQADGGDVRWWRYRGSDAKNGKLTVNASRYVAIIKNITYITNPIMFTYNSKYHFFVTNSDYNICHFASEQAYNQYPSDYSGNGTKTPYVNILTAYNINNGTTWKNVGGMTAFESDGKWYVAHHASANSSQETALQIRSLHWISKEQLGSQCDVPVLSPEPYSQADNNPVNTTDLEGVWYFGNLKTLKTADAYNAINEKVELFSGGSATYNDKNYTWTYDETTRILTLKLDVTIFMYVQGVTNYDSGKVTLAASGVTSDAKNSSYWMEKE